MENKLICTLFKNSSFIIGNNHTSSIIQELCLVINVLFELNIKFQYSYNTNKSNVLINNLPKITYGPHIFKNDEILNFIQTNILNNNKDILNLLKEIKYSTIILNNLEKLIIVDLQLCLHYFNFIHNNKSLSTLRKVFNFILQPINTFKSITNDYEYIQNITTLIGISSIYEALETIEEIYKKIEQLLNDLGEDYCINLKNREINYVDLLIYSSYKTCVRLISTEKLNKYSISTFKSINRLVLEIDYLILNKIKIKNICQLKHWKDINIPKIILNNNSFNNYLDTIDDKVIEKKTLFKRQFISTLMFVGGIILLSLNKFNKYK